MWVYVINGEKDINEPLKTKTKQMPRMMQCTWQSVSSL